MASFPGARPACSCVLGFPDEADRSRRPVQFLNRESDRLAAEFRGQCKALCRYLDPQRCPKAPSVQLAVFREPLGEVLAEVAHQRKRRRNARRSRRSNVDVAVADHPQPGRP